MAEFSVIDYRTSYLSGQFQIDERDWAADHCSAIIGTTGQGVDYYKARNPSMQIFIYDLIWHPQGARSVPTNPATDRVLALENWLAANGYTVETAFIHAAGSGGQVQHRISFSVWGSLRNAIDPAHPGVIAYYQNRVINHCAVRPSGYRYDSVFFDTVNSAVINQYIPNVTLEYTNRNDWYTAFESLLSTLGPLVPAGFVHINAAVYVTTRDASMVDAAGGWTAEALNNPYNSGGYSSWSYIDTRLAAGTKIDFGTGRSAALKNTYWGNGYINESETMYSRQDERILMAEYVNYLMVMNNPTTIHYQPYFNSIVPINTPFDITWLEAFEYDLGAPVGARAQVAAGVDGAGQSYKIFTREFANGLVVYHPQILWSAVNIGHITKVTVTLPAGTWYQLWPDGTIDASPSTTIGLNRIEAAIFVKGPGVPLVGPPNTTASKAQNLILPSSTVQDTDDGVGNVETVWYKFTAGTNDRYVSLLFFSDEYAAKASIYTDVGLTLLYGTGIASTNNAVQFPVNPGYTYWIKIEPVGLPSSGPPFELEISGLTYIQQAISTGSIFIPDDTNGLPGVAVSGIDGEVLDFVFPFPAGRAGDIAHNGNFLVDDIGAGNFKLYDENFNLLYTSAFPWAGAEALIRFNRVARIFYVADQGPNAIVTRINSVNGYIGPVSWTLVGVEMSALASVNDESVLYYYDQTALGNPIEIWDLVLDAYDSSLATGIAGHKVVDLLVLEDDKIVALFYNPSGGVNSITINVYDSIGTLLVTATLSGTQRVGVDPKLAYSSLSPNRFWIWEHHTTQEQFTEFDLNLIVVTQFQTSEYKGGKYDYTATKTPTNRVGHSQLSSFFVLTGAIVTPPPVGGPGPGPGTGPPPVIPPVIPPVVDDCVDEEACPNNLFGPLETASEICPT